MKQDPQNRLNPRTTALVLGCLGIAALGFAVALRLWQSYGAKEPFVDLVTVAEQARSTSAPAPDPDGGLRFAVATMWSVESTFVMYQRLVTRIAHEVGRKDAFVLRPSYASLREALERHQIDVALVGTGPYVCALPGGHIKLLVMPEFEPGLTYHSVLLVPAASPLTGFKDLRGATIAFSDPESFAGFFVPYVELAQAGLDPQTFFKKMVFTGSHDRSIEAVAAGIADAAAVHSIVWYSAKRRDPSLASRLKEIWHSEDFGPPPVIVPVDIPSPLEAKLREAFLGLDGDEEGREILSALGIRRFVPARPEDYGSATALYKRFSSMSGKPP